MKKKMVFAHLLTWFQSVEYSGKWEMWNSAYQGSEHNPEIIHPNGYRDIASLSNPLIGPYDSNDPEVMEYQLLTMKLAGIDGVIIDWDGRFINQYRHVGFMNILPMIKKFDMKIMICFEEWAGYWPINETESREQQLEKAITEIEWIHKVLLSKDEYYKIQGKAPLLVFRKIPEKWFTSQEWQQIKERTEALNIHYLFNDVYDASFHQVSDGYYTWVSGFQKETNLNTLDYYQKEFKSYRNKLDALPKETLFIGSVMPGFNDSPVNGWGGGARIAPRYNLLRYQTAWENMRKYDVDFVQIVTWNDWNEGSQIEPCDKYGYAYIQETKKQIDKYKQYISHVPLEALEYPLFLFKLRETGFDKDLLYSLSKALGNKDIKAAQNIIKLIKEKENEKETN